MLSVVWIPCLPSVPIRVEGANSVIGQLNPCGVAMEFMHLPLLAILLSQLDKILSTTHTHKQHLNRDHQNAPS